MLPPVFSWLRAGCHGFCDWPRSNAIFFSFCQAITCLKLCSRDLAKRLHPQLFIDDLHALHLYFLRYFGLVFAGFVISFQHFITASVTHKGHKRFSTANKHFEDIQIGLHLTLAIESELFEWCFVLEWPRGVREQGISIERTPEYDIRHARIVWQRAVTFFVNII